MVLVTRPRWPSTDPTDERWERTDPVSRRRCSFDLASVHQMSSEIERPISAGIAPIALSKPY